MGETHRDGIHCPWNDILLYMSIIHGRVVRFFIDEAKQREVLYVVSCAMAIRRRQLERLDEEEEELTCSVPEPLPKQKGASHAILHTPLPIPTDHSLSSDPHRPCQAGALPML